MVAQERSDLFCGLLVTQEKATTLRMHTMHTRENEVQRVRSLFIAVNYTDSRL